MRIQTKLQRRLSWERNQKGNFEEQFLFPIQNTRGSVW